MILIVRGSLIGISALVRVESLRREHSMDWERDQAEFDDLWPYVQRFQRLATKYGIRDIFQDNGGKYLQLSLVLKLLCLPGREGNDLKDEAGNEFEVKTVNRAIPDARRAQVQFTTHHHLNPTIIAKYRKVKWYFAVYDGIELIEIYVVTPDELEPCFRDWEGKLADKLRANPRVEPHLNNPKIGLSFVRRVGELVYSAPGRGERLPLEEIEEAVAVREPRVRG